MAKATKSTTGSTGPTDSVLPQIVNLTPEEEAALDEAWDAFWAENEAKAAKQQQQQPLARQRDKDVSEQ